MEDKQGRSNLKASGDSYTILAKKIKKNYPHIFEAFKSTILEEHRFNIGHYIDETKLATYASTFKKMHNIKYDDINADKLYCDYIYNTIVENEDLIMLKIL